MPQLTLNAEEKIMIAASIDFVSWLADQVTEDAKAQQQVLQIGEFLSNLLSVTPVDTAFSGYCCYFLHSLVYEDWDGEGKEPKTVSYQYYVEINNGLMMLGRESVLTPMDKWMSAAPEYRYAPEYDNMLPDYVLYIRLDRDEVPEPFDLYTESAVKDFSEVFSQPGSISTDGFMVEVDVWFSA